MDEARVCEATRHSRQLLPIHRRSAQDDSVLIGVLDANAARSGKGHGMYTLTSGGHSSRCDGCARMSQVPSRLLVRGLLPRTSRRLVGGGWSQPLPA